MHFLAVFQKSLLAVTAHLKVWAKMLIKLKKKKEGKWKLFLVAFCSMPDVLQN